MNKLQELINRCKGSVELEANSHRSYYETVEKAIEEEDEVSDEVIDPELAKRMIKENSYISLYFYPDTPIGFYKVYGTDVEEVTSKALKILKELIKNE